MENLTSLRLTSPTSPVPTKDRPSPRIRLRRHHLPLPSISLVSPHHRPSLRSPPSQRRPRRSHGGFWTVLLAIGSERRRKSVRFGGYRRRRRRRLLHRPRPLRIHPT